MPRPRQNFGPNIRKIVERAPPRTSAELFSALDGPDGPIADLPELDLADDATRLSDHLAALDADVLCQLEDLSRKVLELSEDKGPTSLQTVAHQKMYNPEIEEFERQPDELCKSIWTFVHHGGVFDDAQSFHAARRYREHGSLYSAFEVAEDTSTDIRSDEIDLDVLCESIRTELGLSAKTSATAMELPKTRTHPPSILVAVRHGGALSSIQDHRDDGLRKTYYYRPANEAILIYTPGLRKLEICANRYIVREKTSRKFAEVVLGQDLSKKPLTSRNYSLERFKTSFFLPLPDLDDVEVLSAVVTEFEMRLGSWKRRLKLTVTPDDDIEKIAGSFLDDAMSAARLYGYSRVTIVTTFMPRGGDAKETLSLWVNSDNTSNAQNAQDPRLRDIGTRLLQHWGIMEEQRLLNENETPRYFENLLFLCDFPDDEIEAGQLMAVGVDIDRLRSAQLISKKTRQQIILIDDGGETSEAELETGENPGEVTVKGPYGEDLGTAAEAHHTVYKIERPYLLELVLDAVRSELGSSRADIVADHMADFGLADIGDREIPVYLVWALGHNRKPELMDLEFRRRHHAGPGLVLVTGQTDIPYLGPNVVIPLMTVFTAQDDALVLDPEALERAWRSGQSLVIAGDAAQVIRHGPKRATLHLPGQPPLNLFGEMQAILFERLIERSRLGETDVRTGDLMKNMGSTSPSQLFPSGLWREVKDVYMTQVKSKSWRLGSPDPTA